MLRDDRRLFRGGLGIALLFVFTNVYLQFADYPVLFACTFILFFLLLIFVIINIIKMLISAKEIKLSFISGCLAGYLMIGLCLAFFLMAAKGLNVEILTESNAALSFNAFIYFSLVTMTSIGYGDISPLHPVVRTAAVLTGVCGQFYMAVVVAAIVGKLMRKSNS